MDARRFDRNADQLCQILAHVALLKAKMPQHGQPQLEQLWVSLNQSLQMNDELGKMAEKGLI